MATWSVPYVVFLDVEASDAYRAQGAAENLLCKIIDRGSKAIGVARPDYSNGCDYGGLDVVCSAHEDPDCAICSEADVDEEE